MPLHLPSAGATYLVPQRFPLARVGTSWHVTVFSICSSVVPILSNRVAVMPAILTVNVFLRQPACFSANSESQQVYGHVQKLGSHPASDRPPGLLGFVHITSICEGIGNCLPSLEKGYQKCHNAMCRCTCKHVRREFRAL